MGIVSAPSHLLRRDLLGRRIRRDAETYWNEKKQDEGEQQRYRHQF